LASLAHYVERRTDLDGFIARVEVVVRARVVVATRPADAGAFPLLTGLEVERVLKGGDVPAHLEIAGNDDHAATLREGQRALLFLGRPPTAGHPYSSEQRKGETSFVRAGEEAAWNAYVTEVAAAARAGADF